MVMWFLPDVCCGLRIVMCMALRQTEHLVHQHKVLIQGDLGIKEILRSRAGLIACVQSQTSGDLLGDHTEVVRNGVHTEAMRKKELC